MTRARRLLPTSSPASRPAHGSLRTVCPVCLCDSRQHAEGFNQPLTFDTSRVTNMYGMFWVSLPAPCPPLRSAVAPALPCARCACTAVSPAASFASPGPQSRAPHRVPCLRDPRQSARAFNQPLSFDLSSVTDMSYIFFDTRRLSAANKLLIRCAWAGSAFDSAASVPGTSNPSAVYGSGWALGSCPPPPPSPPSSCTLTSTTSCQQGDVVLYAPTQTGSNIKGLLLVWHNNNWGTVCDDVTNCDDPVGGGSANCNGANVNVAAGKNLAAVVCRALGNTGGDEYNANGASSGYPIVVDGTENYITGCAGTEARLSVCPWLRFGDHNCGHHEDVGVTCIGTSSSPPPPPPPSVAWATAVAISDQGRVLTDIGKEEFNAQFRLCPVVRYSLKTVVHSVYVRTSSVPVGMNAYDYFTKTWSSNNNKRGTDFEIYDSLNDAQAENDPWSFCNFDDPGVGYPRDCGKSGKVDGQWFSMSRAGAIFELFTGAPCPSPAALVG